MKYDIELSFETIIPNEVYNYKLIDNINNKVYKDSVCILQYTGHTIIRDDAINPYEFWLDIKKIVNKKKVTLKCNKIDILKEIHSVFRKITLKDDDPWLF